MRLYRYVLIALAGILLLGGALLGALTARAIGVWTPAPALAAPRSGQAAFLLPDGRVLFYGGTPAVGDPTTGELYDPARGSRGVTRPRPDAQGQGAPVLLADGKLLLTGGELNLDIDPNSARTLATAQTYDPDMDAYTPVAALNIARVNHTATVLPDGAVLVVGGSTGGGVGPGLGTNAVAQAERYIPLTNGWSPAGALATARSLHTATLLQDGRVLVVGGAPTPGRSRRRRRCGGGDERLVARRAAGRGPHRPHGDAPAGRPGPRRRRCQHRRGAPPRHGGGLRSDEECVERRRDPDRRAPRAHRDAPPRRACPGGRGRTLGC